jgi:lauroyl/myristoyl acyltransferase
MSATGAASISTRFNLPLRSRQIPKVLDLVLTIAQLVGHYLFVPVLSGIALLRMRVHGSRTVLGIRIALGLDAPRARAIYRSSVADMVAMAVSFFFLARSSARRVDHCLASVGLSGEAHLLGAVADPRPLLIVTMHMGAFPVGMLRLLRSIRSDRKLCVFKFNAQTRNEVALFRLIREIKHDAEPLRAGEEGGRRAFLELRKGNAVAMMIDAEAYVTGREPVNFFGRCCSMQSGPAMLSVLTNATIVPLITRCDQYGQLQVHIDAPLYPVDPLIEETRAAAVSRLTQQLATVMETWIRAAPDQCHTWPQIAHILLRGPLADTRPRNAS